MTIFPVAIITTYAADPHELRLWRERDRDAVQARRDSLPRFWTTRAMVCPDPFEAVASRLEPHMAYIGLRTT